MTYDEWLAEAQVVLALAKLRNIHVSSVSAKVLAGLWSGKAMPNGTSARYSYESWCKYVGHDPVA